MVAKFEQYAPQRGIEKPYPSSSAISIFLDFISVFLGRIAQSFAA